MSKHLKIPSMIIVVLILCMTLSMSVVAAEAPVRFAAALCSRMRGGSVYAYISSGDPEADPGYEEQDHRRGVLLLKGVSGLLNRHYGGSYVKHTILVLREMEKNGDILAVIS